MLFHFLLALLLFMTAPNLQAQGTIATGVTTGVPSITIPTHQADDILVVSAIAWVPNTAGDAAQIPTPSGWNLLGTQVGQPAGTRDGWIAHFWRRATGAGHTVTMTRGASWDTGTDTCFNGRAYVVRGCITTGDPWDAVATSGPHTAANQAFPAVTVSGEERTVIQFGGVTDNLAFSMAATGWTTGTEANDNGGTDSAFQTARKDNVSSSTSADTATVTAPAAGAYGFLGVSFKPPLTINPNAGAHAHAATSPAITQEHAISPAAGSHGHTASSPAISQEHALSPAAAIHAHVATNPTIEHVHVLAPANAAHAHASTSPTVTEDEAGQPADNHAPASRRGRGRLNHTKPYRRKPPGLYMHLLATPQVGRGLVFRDLAKNNSGSLLSGAQFAGAAGCPGGFGSINSSGSGEVQSSPLAGTWPTITVAISFYHQSNTPRTLVRNWNVVSTQGNLGLSTYSSGSFARTFSCSAGSVHIGSPEATNTCLRWLCTYDGSTLRWYENGLQIGSNAGSGDALTDISANVLELGASFDGFWDNFLICREPFSPAMAMADYQASRKGYTSGPIVLNWIRRSSLASVAGAAGADIDPNDANHAHAATSPAITQEHIVSPSSAAHAHSATSPTLTQEHIVSPASALHDHAATSPTISQVHTVSPAAASHAHSATSPAITQVHVLAIDSAQHAHAATSPILTQVHVVSPDNTLHAHTATSPNVVPDGSVVPDDTHHAHVATSPTLSQVHIVSPADGLHAHAATSPLITQLHVIAPANALHAQTVTSPVITVGGNIPKFPAMGLFRRLGLAGDLVRSGLAGTLRRAGLTATFERKDD